MQCRTPRMLNAECISVSSSDVGRDVGEEDVACACDRGLQGVGWILGLATAWWCTNGGVVIWLRDQYLVSLAEKGLVLLLGLDEGLLEQVGVWRYVSMDSEAQTVAQNSLSLLPKRMARV